MRTHYVNTGNINCSISTNNSDILSWLYNHGYTNSVCFCPNDQCIFVTESPKKIYGSNNPYFFKMVKGQYDSLYGLYCGDDVEMFKALTALSNDSDKDQMFVLDTNLASIDNVNNISEKGSLVRCLRDKWNVDILEDGTPCPFSSKNIPAHKASIEEIINFYCK